MAENQPGTPPAPSWSEARRAARAERRENGGWIIGLILVLVGVALMLQNLGAPEIHNWWALFILLPALGSLAEAVRAFRSDGSVFSARILGPLVVGLVLLGVTAAFLFELSIDWRFVGPSLLILVGLAALFAAFAGRR